MKTNIFAVKYFIYGVLFYEPGQQGVDPCTMSSMIGILKRSSCKSNRASCKQNEIPQH